MSENNIPNLDAMTREELMEFWRKWQRDGSRKEAAAMLGCSKGERPVGYIKAADNLANYACNKATAMGLRLEGKIQAAVDYESICDRIYQRLPEHARW
ncbi:hypothetical protein ABMY26_06645 (plasmid) [Azospirillum sp. HJ39]|uniref:hypothetical protein n=1 Tax=Azospirillum sp. HJ39 TaxID=3159496 RepID=UPI00355796A2